MNEQCRALQLSLLENIEDDVVYCIEALLQDFTGEAKTELSTLLSQLHGMIGLVSGYRDGLIIALRGVLAKLRANSASRSARDQLITLRQRVANTRLQLAGRPGKYHYAGMLTAAQS